MLKVILGVFLILCGSLYCENNRPNIVLVVSDEENNTPFGWEEVIEPWSQQNLPGRNWLKEHGVNFNKHNIAASACVPSRGALYLGQYPQRTGMFQTNGFAKQDGDKNLTWLSPNEWPTLGHFLGAAGYALENRRYIGKFHLSEVQLRDAKDRILQTLSPKFVPIENNIKLYKEHDVLEPFGFSGWVGPEPHGPNLENDGEANDPRYVEEFKDFINLMIQKKNNGNDEPFFAAINLVNPHDVVLIWALMLAGKFKIDDNAPLPPLCRETDYLDLANEPKIHQDYKEQYNKFYCWDYLMKKVYSGDENIGKIRRFYYDLIKKSDERIMEIINILRDSPFFDDTIIIFTSDHGDLLGRRGGQQQKFHNLNREVVEVPFIVANPNWQPRKINQHTSHIDILPTILGLLGLDENELRSKLVGQFQNVRPLVGQDLSEIIRGQEQENPDRQVYLCTQDEISRGENKYSATWYNLLPSWLLPYVPYGTFKTIEGRRFLEAVKFHENSCDWSFIRYFAPENENLVEEYCLYNISEDGFEIKNLVDAKPEMVEQCLQRLEECRRQYH